jgi:hypothetical protein
VVVAAAEVVSSLSTFVSLRFLSPPSSSTAITSKPLMMFVTFSPPSP